MDIEFDFKGDPIGGKITNCLSLETCNNFIISLSLNHNSSNNNVLEVFVDNNIYMYTTI